MKVNPENSELQDYSKKLDGRLKNETRKKEAELKSVGELYQKKIESAKITGQDQYINSLNQNEELLVSAAQDYENKLKGYKENLGKTQTVLTQQEMSLKQDNMQKIENAKDQHKSNIDEQFRQAQDNQAEINADMKNNVQIITNKSAQEKASVENKAQASVSALAREYSSKNASEERNYRNQLGQDVIMHQEALKSQQTELKNMADKTTEKNKRLVSEKINVQKGELSYLDNHQKDILTQKSNDFKVRYDNIVKEHNQLLAELTNHFEVDVKKMVEQSAVKKKAISNKAEDSFYRIETLSPKIVETEKEFKVSLPVPEYERENVHLSVRGRGVKMTLTRRFADSFEEVDGSINRSTKNELFSREFPSKDLLNAKLVDQKYENGVLTYRIKKL